MRIDLKLKWDYLWEMGLSFPDLFQVGKGHTMLPLAYVKVGSKIRSITSNILFFLS